MTTFDRFRLRRRMLEFGLASLAWPTLARTARATVEYPVVRNGMELVFPRDYGAHPLFRVEWWYVTGWLGPPRAGDPAFVGGTPRDRRAYGFQVTFFRVRPGIAENNPSHFAPNQLLFAHAAIADPAMDRLRTAQRGAREGFGLAGAHTDTTQVWIDRWSLTRTGTGYRAIVGATDFAFDLELVSTQPLLLEGDAGVSRKGPDPGDASFYYSEPQLAVHGRLDLGGDRLEGVEREGAGREGVRREVSGVAWLDHEWSSSYLAAGAVGWDWTGINLDDGGALMAFRIRNQAGNPVWAGGTLRDASGQRTRFGPGEVSFAPLRRWVSPRTRIDYPVAMRVIAGDIDVTLEPLIDDQELDARASVGAVYWEGAMRALVGGRTVGRGYLELNGYGAPLQGLAPGS